MSPTEVDAHLHIVIFANPADMITAELRKHLKKKYKKKVVWYDTSKVDGLNIKICYFGGIISYSGGCFSYGGGRMGWYINCELFNKDLEEMDYIQVAEWIIACWEVVKEENFNSREEYIQAVDFFVWNGKTIIN